jgi:serine/threonine protein kinase
MQIGKGGYGDVFLARKTDTKELCALKRMKKAALIKQDEVCHSVSHVRITAGGCHHIIRGSIGADVLNMHLLLMSFLVNMGLVHMPLFLVFDAISC